jgi:hypothetical protein
MSPHHHCSNLPAPPPHLRCTTTHPRRGGGRPISEGGAEVAEDEMKDVSWGDVWPKEWQTFDREPQTPHQENGELMVGFILWMMKFFIIIFFFTFYFLGCCICRSGVTATVIVFVGISTHAYFQFVFTPPLLLGSYFYCLSLTFCFSCSLILSSWSLKFCTLNSNLNFNFKFL